MSHKTIAILVFIAWAVLSYALSFVGPRKCSEHITAEEKYKNAISAPFRVILGLVMIVGIIWATQETFFQ